MKCPEAYWNHSCWMKKVEKQDYKQNGNQMTLLCRLCASLIRSECRLLGRDELKMRVKTTQHAGLRGVQEEFNPVSEGFYSLYPSFKVFESIMNDLWWNLVVLVVPLYTSTPQFKGKYLLFAILLYILSHFTNYVFCIKTMIIQQLYMLV